MVTKFDKGDTVYMIDHHLKSLIYDIEEQLHSFDRYTGGSMEKIAISKIVFNLKYGKCFDEEYLMTTRMVLTEKICKNFDIG